MRSWRCAIGWGVRIPATTSSPWALDRNSPKNRRSPVDGSRVNATPVPEVSPAALGVLGSHQWPGNVRELRNVLETAALRNRTGILQPEDLRLPSSPSAESTSSIAPLAEVGRLPVPRALAATRRAVDEALALDYAAALSNEARLQGEMSRGHDFEEGVTAFLEKRAPVFRDR